MGVIPRIDYEHLGSWPCSVHAAFLRSGLAAVLCCVFSLPLRAVRGIRLGQPCVHLRRHHRTSFGKDHVEELAVPPSRSGPSTPGNTGRGMRRSWRGRPLVLTCDAPTCEGSCGGAGLPPSRARAIQGRPSSSRKGGRPTHRTPE